MNLIEALGGADVEYAVCTTFPFEPLFFGNYAIDPLQDAGVVTPVVLMDGQKYEQLARRNQLSSRAIGNHYYLEPISVSGTFHPKVNFLAGEEACHVGVSSANLTLGEYSTAAQLGQTITVSRELDDDEDSLPPEAIHVAKDVRRFIQYLIADHVSGHDVRTQIDRAVNTTEWLEDLDRPTEVFGGFFHNLEEPILQQVIDELGDITTAVFFAPFFGSEKTLSNIETVIEADQYELLVSDGNTHLSPSDAVAAFGESVTFRPLKHETSRWLHAKGLLLEGPWGRATLYGSPNITGRALLDTASSGNVEAALLSVTNETHGESSLWHQSSFPAHPGEQRNPDSFDFVEYTPAIRENSTATLTLHDARVERFESEIITARFVAPEIDDGDAVILESDGGETLQIDWQRDSDDEQEGVTVSLPEAWAQSIVRLRLSDERHSNFRQITTEPTEGTREVTELLRSDGRAGIQSLVDEALFFDVGVATVAISQATSKLAERYQQRQDNPGASIDGQDAEEGSWATGGTRITTKRRKTHLELKDGMDYAQKRIETLLEEPPTVRSVEELLDHFDNLWYYVIKGLIRSALSPQLQAGDEPYETELNVERLHSICVNRIQTIISSQFLVRSRIRLNQIRRIEPDTTAEVLDRDQLTGVFAVHPATLLSLMEWHDDAFFERFGFLRHYHEALTVADPLIGELLINGEHISRQMSEFERTLEGQLSAFGDRVDHDLSLPGDLDTGLELLFYGFWYRELSQQRDTDLFDNAAIFEHYNPAGLAEMARIALRGKQRVEHRREYEGLRKGTFDPIVRLMEGANDPTPQLESIISYTDSTQRH